MSGGLIAVCKRRGGWSPLSLPGLRALYEADAGITLGGPQGATATTVADQSGNARDLGWDPANPDSDPLHVAGDEFGGATPAPGIAADGTNDRLFLKPIGTPPGSGTKDTLASGLSFLATVRLDPSNRDYSHGTANPSGMTAANLVHWLDPSDSRNVEAYATKVHRWLYRSGPAGTQIGAAIQPKDARKPTTSTLAGRNAIAFGGGAVNLYTQAQIPNAVTLFNVIRLDSIGAGDHCFAATAGASISSASFPWGIRANQGGNWQVLTQVDYITSTKPCVVGNTICVCTTMTLNAQEAFINNTSIGTRTDAQNNVGYIFYGAGVYGLYPGTFDSTATWTMGEQLVFDAVLSAGDRTAVYNYLAAKWGPFA